jgi:hypothetical protein
MSPVNWVPPVHTIGGGFGLSLPQYPTMDESIPWSLVQGGFKKTPHFNTDFQETASRMGNSAVGYMPFPTWDFSVDLNVVPGAEWKKRSILQKFLGVFMACKGRGQLFFFRDPNDHGVGADTGILLNVTPGAAGYMLTFPDSLGNIQTLGDGVSTRFQFARSLSMADSAGVDILQHVTGPRAEDGSFGAPVILVDGVPTSTTFDTNGVVVFSSAPVVNAVLTWIGQFRYLCRFSEDTVKDLGRVNKGRDSEGDLSFLWSASGIEFQSEFV